MTQLLKSYSLLILSVLVFASCTIDGYEQGSSPLTNEEAILTGQIIGESVSENQNGLLSTFSEAFAIPTQTNLLSGPSLLSTGSFRNLNNYSYEFYPDSGIHEVTYTIRDEELNFISNTEYTLKYIFVDQNQNTIEFPDQQRDDIEAVDFSATRTGDIDANTKTSIFTRTDRLIVNGLTSESEIISIDGFHSGEGTYSRIEADGSRLDREYVIDFNYLDIQINKNTVQTNRSFSKGVNGALSYESTIRQNVNTVAETKIVNGTIELNGDGTALLKFRELLDTYRLKLQNGFVFDDDEFEGRVTGVNLDDNIITLANGQRIQINNQTEFDEGDFNSLREVSEGLADGNRIIAEGDYYQPNENENLWIATEIEFEFESNEFEDLIESIDLETNSFSLLNGDQYFITSSTIIEFDDGLTSREDIADALNLGIPVEADGEFKIDPVTGNRNVTEVEFETDYEEFEEDIISVNLSENYFTIESGRDIKVTEETLFDDEGLQSLQEIEEAIEDGIAIEAEGDIYYNSSIGFWIAVEIEAETQEDDED